MFQTPEYNIFESVSSYLKIYPTFCKLYEYDSPIKVRKAGYEKSHVSAPKYSNYTNPLNIFCSLRRTKTVISDLTLSNDFDQFCTFTFAADRQNVDKCKAKMSKWLDNQRLKYGSFPYLIVPEFHKDGESIHFHALFKGYGGKLVRATNYKTGKPLLQRGRKVYNIKSYRSGFATLVQIDDVEKVSSYVKKYITKDMPQFEGKKRFWSSQGLVRPTKIANPELDPFTFSEFILSYAMEGLTISELPYTLPLIPLRL